MYRSRRTEKQYGRDKLSQKSDKCPFCHLEDKEVNPRERRIVATNEHSVILDAMYPYEIWDGFAVTEHLMVMPKRHVGTLSELTPLELSEIVDIIQQHEQQGYDVYLRGKTSGGRTVPLHQHTHLIKTKGKRAKRIVYVQKPYIVTKF